MENPDFIEIVLSSVCRSHYDDVVELNNWNGSILLNVGRFKSNGLLYNPELVTHQQVGTDGWYLRCLYYSTKRRELANRWRVLLKGEPTNSRKFLVHVEGTHYVGIVSPKSIGRRMEI